jgi:chromosome segregation ATPase
MERARTTAVRLEQELAHTQDLLAAETRRADTAERAVLVLLDHWEAANQTIDRLHRELDQTDDDIAAFEQYVRNTFRPAGALANEQDDAWSYPAQHAAPQPGPRPSTWRRVLTFLGLAD